MAGLYILIIRNFSISREKKIIENFKLRRKNLWQLI